MNSQWVGSKPIRTNWATKKPASYASEGRGNVGGGGETSGQGPHNPDKPPPHHHRLVTSSYCPHLCEIVSQIALDLYFACRHHPPLSYEEVFQKSSPTNCTVYCGGLSNTDDENAIRRAFSSFGRIVDVRFFRDKGRFLKML